MSDHGWKSMLARISRWLATSVRVDFNQRTGPVGTRSVFGPSPQQVETAPVRFREPVRFADRVPSAAADRQRAREHEFYQLQYEIARLVHGDEWAT